MDKIQFNISRGFGIALFVLGTVLVWRHFSRKSDLHKYYEVEGDLQGVSIPVNTVTQTALEMYPLATVGDQPYAGMRLDPFMKDSPANEPKLLDWLQSLPTSTRPSIALGNIFADPNRSA